MMKFIVVGYSLFGDGLNYLNNCDIILLGKEVFDRVIFKSELSGKTEKLAEMGRLSKKLDTTLFSYVTTDDYGIKRNSIVASEKGKLLGISDESISSLSAVSPNEYKLYSLKNNKVGLAVGDDLKAFSLFKGFSSFGCDMAVNISDSIKDFNSIVLIKTLSYLNGISICSMIEDKIVVSTEKGIVKIYKQPYGVIRLPINKEYREITLKTRGFY